MLPRVLKHSANIPSPLSISTRATHALFSTSNSRSTIRASALPASRSFRKALPPSNSRSVAARRSLATMTVMPPTNGGPLQPGQTKRGNFTLLQNFHLPYAPSMGVQKWKSEKTGLTLVWADFQSPLLNAYMVVPTEIFEDTGSPHTLEHLIFMGSHDYPYKGILDSLANRAFASGTNAWTANDHTAYTLTTASSDGFLRMLPVYTDHLFRPTLTKEGFTTEVYHLNGKGQDAGVVFSEMQARENTSGDLLQLQMQRSIYPEGNAYRSETGGLMEKLRVLTIEQIRDYHGSRYAPHNAALVVTGPLPQEELLQTVNAIDEGLIKAGKAPGPSGPPGWSRPFLTTPSAKAPAIDGTEAGDLPTLIPVDQDGSAREKIRRKNTVEFPEEDESTGEVFISWVGTKWGQWMEEEALGVLDTYLTDSAVSPIQKEFVEQDEPLCTDVYLQSEAKAGKGLLSAYFTSVPTEKLDTVDHELIKLLESVVKEGVDMKRMAMCIKRDRIKLLNQLETKPSDSFADVLITDHVYGEAKGNDLAESMDDVKRFEELEKWSAKQWGELIQRWYIDNPRMVVLGKPSKSLAAKLKKETKSLEDKRRADLGEEGLKKYEDALEAARKQNDRAIPEEILSSFQIPSEETIVWIRNGRDLIGPKLKSTSKTVVEGISAQNGNELDEQVKAYLGKETEAARQLSFPIHFVHVPSAFVTVSLVFPTSRLAPELRPLVHLYLATFFSLPIKKADGTVVPYEEVVRGLDEDTLEFDGTMGVGRTFAENISIELKVEVAKYSKAIEWLRDLIWNSVFSPERLKVSAAKTTQSLPEVKRDGSSVSWALSRSLTHDMSKSTNLSTSILGLLDLMPDLNKELAESPSSVVAKMEEIRKTVFQPSNMVASVGGDVLSVARPVASWTEALSSLPSTVSAVEIDWSKEVLTPLGRSPSRKGLICYLPTIESSYAVFTARGLQGYDDPSLPSVVVALAILNALESPLWRYIRGAGLAYGASIRSDVEAGLLHFSLYRSPDSAKAFNEAKKAIEELVSDLPADQKKPGLVLDQVTLDSAKSMLHFNVADAEGTVSQAATEVFIDEILRGLPRGRGRRLLESVGSVTLQDVSTALKDFILPIFDPKTSVAIVVSTPSRGDEIKEELQKLGYEMERKDLKSLGDEEEEEEGEEGEEDGSEESSEDEEMKDA